VPHVNGTRADLELVAEDMVTDIEYFRQSPMGGRFDGILGDVYSTSKYELVLEMPTYAPDLLMYYLGYEDRSTMEAPETRAVGADKYENHVGTGPFMFEEYVVGSYMSYVRNPNYWQTETLDGVVYQLPFIDRVVFPIIPDVGTQIAALRTGTLDMDELVDSIDWASLDQTNPELEYARYADSSNGVSLLCTEPPFDDVNVRRAMMIGTDKAAARKFGLAEDLPMHTFPSYYGNPDVYTPMEELPADCQILYDYNPTLAIDMLDKAGYPDGFTIDYYCSTINKEPEVAAMMKDQWAKIGVTVNIKAFEWTTMRIYQYSGTYHGACPGGNETANPVMAIINLAQTGGFLNTSLYSNPVVDDYCAQIKAETDYATQMALIKEVSLIILHDVPQITLYMMPQGHYWWPWVKGHYGERTLADGQKPELITYMWIDQALKKEMGY